MAKDANADELVDTIRSIFRETISNAFRDLPPHQALQLADALCTAWLDNLQGLRVLYRARPKVDGEAISEAWARGNSLVEIMRTFRCSKVTAYKYHPTKLRQDAAA